MLVKQIMSPNLVTITPDTTLHDAAKKMKIHNIGVLPICDGSGLCGVITDRDLTVRGIADGNDMVNTAVRTIMTAKCITCSHEDSLERAIDMMEAHSVRRIIVTDGQERPRVVGILSLDDIARKSQDAGMSGRAFMRFNKRRELAPASKRA